MRKIEEILSILKEKNGSTCLSEISRRMKMSKEEVEKAISRLRSYGYVIETDCAFTCTFVRKHDSLCPWEIGHFLTTQRIGRKIIYRQVLDSTNRKAFEVAREGANEGTCVIAEMQTRGKGRLQRKWFSPGGKNIYVSIVLRPSLSLFEIHTLTFLSSLSVADVVESLCDLKAVLKWPNDVLVEKRKISGTLLEISSLGSKIDFAIVGIGFNVNMEEKDLPENMKKIATSLYMETGRKYDRAFVCASLLNNFEKYYTTLLEGGSSAIRSLWEKRALIKGKQLSVSEGGKVLEGVCEGLDEMGALILKTTEGIKKVYAGDLTF